MSAWMVSEDHVDLLVTAGLAWELGVREQADEVGRMLWAECLKSVKAHYPNDRSGERPGPIDFRDSHVGKYQFQLVEGLVDPEVIDTAVRSYRYQSCEHGGWERSKACAWSGELRQVALGLMPAFTARYGPLNEQLRMNSWAGDDRQILSKAQALRAANRQSGIDSLPQ